MTVALVLAAGLDAGLRGQLAALGARQVDAAERSGPGLLTVAAAARAAGERLLICVGDESVPEEVLTRLLGAGGTAAFTGRSSPGGPAEHRGGALIVDTPDLDALASSAESLAARHAAPAEVSTLLGELTGRGVGVRVRQQSVDGLDERIDRCVLGLHGLQQGLVLGPAGRRPPQHGPQGLVLGSVMRVQGLL